MENWEWVRRRNEGKRVLGNVVIRHTLRKINKGGKRFCIIPVFFNLVIFFVALSTILLWHFDILSRTTRNVYACYLLIIVLELF